MKKLGKAFTCFSLMFTLLLTVSISAFAATSTDGNSKNTSISTTIQDKYIGSTDGDSAFKKFLNATAPLKQSNYNYSIRKIWGSPDDAMAIDWGTKNNYFTKEQWQSMSDYDRMCWNILFISFCRAAESGNYEYNFGSKEKVQQNFLSNIQSTNQIDKWPDGVYSAFEDIVYWQWQHFKDTGDVYNFMTGGSYLTHKNELANGSSITNSSNSAASKSSIAAATTSSANVVPSQKEQLTQKLRNNIITIVILIILGIGVGYFAFKHWKENRKKNDTE